MAMEPRPRFRTQLQSNFVIAQHYKTFPHTSPLSIFQGFTHCSTVSSIESTKMNGVMAFRNLGPKTKNLVVAGGLTSFVFGVYFYTMKAVAGGDELQVAIDQFEAQKGKKESEGIVPPKA